MNREIKLYRHSTQPNTAHGRFTFVHLLHASMASDAMVAKLSRILWRDADTANHETKELSTGTASKINPKIAEDTEPSLGSMRP